MQPRVHDRNENLYSYVMEEDLSEMNANSRIILTHDENEDVNNENNVNAENKDYQLSKQALRQVIFATALFSITTILYVALKVSSVEFLLPEHLLLVNIVPNVFFALGNAVYAEVKKE